LLLHIKIIIKTCFKTTDSATKQMCSSILYFCLAKCYNQHCSMAVTEIYHWN